MMCDDKQQNLNLLGRLFEENYELGILALNLLKLLVNSACYTSRQGGRDSHGRGCRPDIPSCLTIQRIAMMIE